MNKAGVDLRVPCVERPFQEHGHLASRDEGVGAGARRIRRGEASQVVVPAGATEVALLLSTDVPTGTRAALSIEDHKGLEVWHGDGLVSGPPGGYVVTLPLELLPDGSYVLKVRPQRGAASVYRIRVSGATR